MTPDEFVRDTFGRLYARLSRDLCCKYPPPSGCRMHERLVHRLFAIESRK